MNGIDARVRAWLTWALPFVVVALLVAWETDFGHALKREEVVRLFLDSGNRRLRQ